MRLPTVSTREVKETSRMNWVRTYRARERQDWGDGDGKEERGGGQRGRERGREEVSEGG